MSSISENEKIEKDNLVVLFRELWHKKITISWFVFFAAVLSVLYALSLPNIYKSEALLAPVIDEDSAASSFQNYNSLASLAGINFRDSSGNKSKEAISILDSYNFFEKSFLPNIQLENLMAIDSWDRRSNLISYNPDLFDYKESKWVIDVSFPKTSKPSPQESYKIFKKIFSISENLETGFVKISIDHQSPHIAKKWSDILITEINENFRKIDREEATVAVNYLNTMISDTNLTEIKKVLSELLKNETQKLTLIEARKDYIFRVLDAPIAPETKDKPSRALICIIGTFLGGVLGCIYVILAFLRRTNNPRL